MVVRKYTAADCREMAELFYQTVPGVNARDYTEEQLNAWADGNVDLARWHESFAGHFTLVATDGERITGFGDMDGTGYLDRLYVHKDYQSQGIATAICDRLEEAFAVGKFITHASITAKPFFENRGYQVARKQQVLRKGIFLENYVMEKECRGISSMPRAGKSRK